MDLSSGYILYTMGKDGCQKTLRMHCEESFKEVETFFLVWISSILEQALPFLHQSKEKNAKWALVHYNELLNLVARIIARVWTTNVMCLLSIKYQCHMQTVLSRWTHWPVVKCGGEGFVRGVLQLILNTKHSFMCWNVIYSSIQKGT